MPKIKFRGKTYYSEFEMPPNIRWDYQKEQIRRASTKPLTDVVDMSGDVQERSASTSREELPTTDELYSQSTPADMRHLPSDESINRPSAPIIDPEYSIIEPESSMVIRGLVFGILWSLVLIAIVFLVIEFFRQVL